MKNKIENKFFIASWRERIARSATLAKVEDPTSAKYLREMLALENLCAKIAQEATTVEVFSRG